MSSFWALSHLLLIIFAFFINGGISHSFHVSLLTFFSSLFLLYHSCTLILSLYLLLGFSYILSLFASFFGKRSDFLTRNDILTPTSWCLHTLILWGGEVQGVVNGSDAMEPLIEQGAGWMVLNETRRRLGKFQICALCTCCGGARRVCLASPCCYAINCNIPNRPFGFCSFTPRTCNCFGCNI